jgi:hypothetical protein
MDDIRKVIDMFCTHNESDLIPTVTSDGGDWVVIWCKACDSNIGERILLIDLVDMGIKRAQEQGRLNE